MWLDNPVNGWIKLFHVFGLHRVVLVLFTLHDDLHGVQDVWSPVTDRSG